MSVQQQQTDNICTFVAMAAHACGSSGTREPIAMGVVVLTLVSRAC